MMKNKIILTESELTNLIKKIINEFDEGDLTKMQKVGFKLLTNQIKTLYPYIIDLKPRFDNYRGIFLHFDILFDLKKFYDYEGVEPPKSYMNFPILKDLLLNPTPYLTTHIEGGFKEKSSEFGFKFNDKVEKTLSKLYLNIPEKMKFSKFEGIDTKDDEFNEKWKNSKVPVEISISNWVPKINLDEL